MGGNFRIFELATAYWLKSCLMFLPPNQTLLKESSLQKQTKRAILRSESLMWVLYKYYQYSLEILILLTKELFLFTWYDLQTEFGTPVFRRLVLFSPLIKSIKVLQRAFIHKGKKRVRGSKLYYLMDRHPDLYTIKWASLALQLGLYRTHGTVTSKQIINIHTTSDFFVEKKYLHCSPTHAYLLVRSKTPSLFLLVVLTTNRNITLSLNRLCNAKCLQQRC